MGGMERIGVHRRNELELERGGARLKTRIDRGGRRRRRRSYSTN